MPPLELTPEDRRVIADARVVTNRVADELRPRLLAVAGRVTPTSKRDGTPVTDADVETTRTIAEAIRSSFPDHGIIDEELSTRHPGTRWTWVVDPIDGTSNFTAGLPYWCVSIALTLEGWPVYALIEVPPLGARYEAEFGRGATLDGAPIHVTEAIDWSDPANRHIPLLLTTGTLRRARPARGLNPRVMGSAALDLATVAAGVAAASISVEPKVWDIAAGYLLVTEAGGRYLTLEGEPLLPLRPDLDYRSRSAAAAAGPDESYLAALTAEVVVHERWGRRRR